jgi:hypothetical protein
VDVGAWIVRALAVGASLWAAGLVVLGPAAAASGSAASAPVSSFRERDFAVPVMALVNRLYSGDRPVPRRDGGVHDAHGVRMRLVAGELRDLPRLQATYGLLNLNTYRLTGDGFFLERALAQAGRLVSNMVTSGGAWFVPTPISCHRHGVGSEPIAAPYFSALAQGRTLLFFSRLAAVTGEQRWRTAAGRVFAAFRLREPRRGPCVITVDDGSYLWLQEWPWAGWLPDDTFNGHISAAFGIYEYYCVTRDPLALSLFRGAATTVLHYAPTFRQPGWLSRYCLAHLITNPNYHRIHVQQLLVLHTFTREPEFAHYADLFESDYPAPSVSGSLRICAGTHVVARPAGEEAGARTAVTFAHPVRARVTRRQRMRGDGIFFRVASGPLSGQWIEEEPGRVYLPGPVVQLRYWPLRALTLAAGRTYTARLYGDGGAEVARATMAAGATLAADRGAVVDGYPSVRLSGGELNGYWLRLGSGVTLR